MSHSSQQENYHPSSFAYKWQHATESVQQEYVRLSDLVPLETDQEKCFLLWMAGQEMSIQQTFLAIFRKGGINS